MYILGVRSMAGVEAVRDGSLLPDAAPAPAPAPASAPEPALPLVDGMGGSAAAESGLPHLSWLAFHSSRTVGLGSLACHAGCAYMYLATSNNTSGNTSNRDTAIHASEQDTR